MSVGDDGDVKYDKIPLSDLSFLSFYRRKAVVSPLLPICAVILQKSRKYPLESENRN